MCISLDTVNCFIVRLLIYILHNCLHFTLNCIYNKLYRLRLVQEFLYWKIMSYSMLSVTKTSLLRIITKFLDGSCPCITLQRNSRLFLPIGPPPATQHTTFRYVIIFYLIQNTTCLFHTIRQWDSYRVAAMLDFYMSLVRNVFYLNTSSLGYISKIYIRM